MIRPKPDRLDDLTRRIAAEEEAANRLCDRLAGETAGARAELAEQERRAAAVQRGLDESAEEALRLAVQLDGLRRQVRTVEDAATVLAVAIANQEQDREQLGRVIVSLRAKVEAERLRIAPALAKREKEVEKLQRRLQTLLAYKPELRSTVLTDPTPVADEGSAPC